MWLSILPAEITWLAFFLGKLLQAAQSQLSQVGCQTLKLRAFYSRNQNLPIHTHLHTLITLIKQLLTTWQSAQQGLILTYAHTGEIFSEAIKDSVSFPTTST